jgi:hypothetical protein
MQHESVIEKTAMIQRKMVVPLAGDVYNTNPEIKNIIRKIIALLSIELV